MGTFTSSLSVAEFDPKCISSGLGKFAHCSSNGMWLLCLLSCFGLSVMKLPGSCAQADTQPCERVYCCMDVARFGVIPLAGRCLNAGSELVYMCGLYPMSGGSRKLKAAPMVQQGRRLSTCPCRTSLQPLVWDFVLVQNCPEELRVSLSRNSVWYGQMEASLFCAGVFM